MVKQTTRNVFTPEEFKLLNQCVQCGRACAIKYGSMCTECIVKDLKQCEICDIVLRHGEHLFYTYDIRDNYRDNKDLKVNKESVREFTYRRASFYPPYSDTLCSDCVGWEKRMTNICWLCQRTDWTNTKDNYKLNGNLCLLCAIKFYD